MKRNLLFIVFASVVLNAWSQNVSEGSIGFLEFQESLIDVKFDFSQTKFEDGHDFDWWIEEATSKDVWENKTMPYITKKLINELNDNANEKYIYFTTNSDKADYTMIVTPLTLDKKGNNEIVFVFIDNKSNEVKLKLCNKAKGGKIGSFTNLQGDGFGAAGNSIGKFLKKNVKQKIKKTKNINWGFGITTKKEKEVIK
jgi:hypothetical protein